ncbi:MAG: acetylxylan esterase [Acidobacteriota bacterium]|nr:acetylxylan esterase [Acidobacteriota bacterium]
MRLLLLWFPLAALGQTPAFNAPEDVAYRRADIISEGTRMSAELFAPKSAAGQKLPAIVMAHGRGGVAASLRPEAVAFAKAGYLVLTFDYRGWGNSDSRVILTSPEPPRTPGSTTAPKFTAEVRDVREVVDPLDMAVDWFNAIHWLQAEPQFDTARLGLWGSSYSGGLVVFVAEHDRRVKALHSQVGALDSRPLDAAGWTTAYREATKMARGEMEYPAPGAKVIGNLRGAPIWSKLILYAPVEDLEKAGNCAMQFVIAEKEELFDNKDHVLKAYPRVKGPKNLVTIPKITHYGIYGEARAQARDLAISWFDKHLK